MASRWFPRRLGHGAVLALSSVLLISPAAATPSPCFGDCDLDGAVTVNELVLGVNIALGNNSVASCPPFDRDSSNTVSVDEIIAAVQNALNGCPPEMTGNVVVRGKVLQAASAGGGVSAAGGAEVAASIDRNRDGQIGSGESTTRSADSEGNYTLEFGVAPGERIVLSFRTDDSAPLFRTLEAAADAEVVVNVTLRTAEELECTGSRCSLQGDRLTIADLPANVTGSAQLFNPVTQADAFPGDFADSDGNVLLSGVFASVELTDDAGQPVKQLAAPATLRMQIPRETWAIIADITPGNGGIDVPLYAFDEAAGTWVRDGQAVLEDGAGATIPEGTLASIRNGSYTGNVVARGEVQHFSYWNVDWPIESHGCISGRILDADGQPAAGASVTVRGVTYVGSSTATTGADGRFCVDVLRSENPGEDVDQDGIPGETQRVAIRATYAGRTYDAGETAVPAQPATCNVGCGNIGDVRLTPDRELQISLCTFTVVVRDREGVPVPGAFVFAADETVDPDVAAELCVQTPEQFCLSVGSTDQSGEARLTAAVLDGLFIASLSTAPDGDSLLQRWGEATSSGCPSQPVELTLTDGYRQITLAIELVGSSIRWTPTTYGVTGINVASTAVQKWLVVAPPPGFNSPVAYGNVPAGAEQIIPFSGGAPPPLASGDFVTVFLTVPADDGYPVIGQGFAVVP